MCLWKPDLSKTDGESMAISAEVAVRLGNGESRLKEQLIGEYKTF